MANIESTTHKTNGMSFLKRLCLGTASMMAFAALAGTARADECLLDTNDNGVADGADTDGGADGSGTDSLACGENAEATVDFALAVGIDSQAGGEFSTVVGTTPPHLVLTVRFLATRPGRSVIQQPSLAQMRLRSKMMLLHLAKAQQQWARGRPPLAKRRLLKPTRP